MVWNKCMILAVIGVDARNIAMATPIPAAIGVKNLANGVSVSRLTEMCGCRLFVPMMSKMVSEILGDSERYCSIVQCHPDLRCDTYSAVITAINVEDMSELINHMSESMEEAV